MNNLQVLFSLEKPDIHFKHVFFFIILYWPIIKAFKKKDYYIMANYSSLYEHSQ